MTTRSRRRTRWVGAQRKGSTQQRRGVVLLFGTVALMTLVAKVTREPEWLWVGLAGAAVVTGLRYGHVVGLVGGTLIAVAVGWWWIELTRNPHEPRARGRVSRSLPSWVTRGVVGIVLATFFSDVGHEMVTAVLPLYLATIGLGAGTLGAMEGAADLAFSLSKLAGGVVGHRLERKRPLAAAGYCVTAIGTAAIAFASSAISVGALRVAAWLGRGFRSPLRDFLLADEVDATHFGRAYGIERGADMLGAVAGPALALSLLWVGVSVPTIIAVSFGPSLLSVLFITGFTQNRRAVTAVAPTASQEPSPRLPPRFWWFVAGVLIFGLGDFSRTFLILIVANAMGGSAVPGALNAGVLAYTVHNLVGGLAAFRAGHVADRTGKWRVLLVGYGLGVVTNAVLAGASHTIVGLAFAVMASGVYIAIEETLEKATVAELLPRELRSLGFGMLACANAIGDMVSSLYVGALLSAGRPALAFGTASVLGAVGTGWVFLVARRVAR